MKRQVIECYCDVCNEKVETLTECVLPVDTLTVEGYNGGVEMRKLEICNTCKKVLHKFVKARFVDLTFYGQGVHSRKVKYKGDKNAHRKS